MAGRRKKKRKNPKNFGLKFHFARRSTVLGTPQNWMTTMPFAGRKWNFKRKIQFTASRLFRFVCFFSSRTLLLFSNNRKTKATRRINKKKNTIEHEPKSHHILQDGFPSRNIIFFDWIYTSFTFWVLFFGGINFASASSSNERKLYFVRVPVARRCNLLYRSAYHFPIHFSDIFPLVFFPNFSFAFFSFFSIMKRWEEVWIESGALWILYEPS